MSVIGYTGSGWRYPVAKTGRVRTYKPPVVTAARSSGGSLGNVTLDSILKRYYSQLSTPAQQAAQARNQVNAQIKLAMTGLQNQYASDKALYQHQQDRAAGFAMAALNLAKPDEQQVLDQYRNAASDVAGLGGMLTGAVGAANQAGADEASRQIAELTQGRNTGTALDVPGMQNVARYTGVVLPSADLYTQAASAAAGARFNRLADAEKIQQIATDYGQKVIAAKQELDRNAAALEATRPGLYSQAVNQLASNARSDMATLVSALTLQNTMANTGSMINSRTITDAINQALAPLTAAGKKAGTRKTTVETGIVTAKGKGLDASGNPLPNYHWSSNDPKTRQSIPIPKGYSLDPNDPTQTAIIKTPSSSSSPKGPGGLTPSQTQSIIASRAASLAKLVKGPPYAIVHQPDPFGLGSKVVTYTPALTLAQATQRALSRFPTALRKNPQVIAAVKDALSSVGYKT